MPQFSRGDERDQALLGIYTPLDPFAQATLGFWKIAVLLELPDPNCWVNVSFAEQSGAVCFAEQMATAALLNPIEVVKLAEQSAIVFIEDNVVTVKTCI